MSKKESPGISLARKIAAAFSALPSVEAVALGGSQAWGLVDPYSDIDAYIYTNSAIPLADRERILTKLAAADPALNQTLWDVTDAWRDSETGLKVEAIYWETPWAERVLDRVLVQHRPSNGYSTSHWYTIRNSTPLYDRRGWFATLQGRSKQPYPEELKHAIISRNHAALRVVRDQLERAVQRNDLVSVNHRLTALLESYFDVLFAANGALHPGEKRLLELAPVCCAKVPADMQAQLGVVLRRASSTDQTLVATVDDLIGGLNRLLQEERLLPHG